ncbi:MAG: polysaccharide biosynthesis/export family protein [Bacteroidia bacterium]
MRKYYYLIASSVFLILSGCKSYTSNIILETEEDDINWSSAYEKVVVQNPVKIGDKIQFSVFTNEGEAIIDPSGNLVAQKIYGEDNKTVVEKPTYEVIETGEAHFPLIGKLNVVGLKTSQLDSLLSSKYEKYYNGVYIISKVINKKIIIIGNKGGTVLPYTTNMSLLEAIAIYGGLDDKSKGYNIRVIRGDLKNPEVKVVNLSTIKDMRKSIVSLKPDDIVYIEPVRRPGSESVRDNVFVFNVIQVLLTMAVLLNTLTN